MSPPLIVLDAMGVIYSVNDDVRDLLCPFISEKGGCRNIEKVWELYISASLGRLSSPEFWNAVQVDPALEDEYLERHTLTDGLLDFLKEIKRPAYEIWCLSNDVSEWSKKLRIRFELDNYITGFVISGDVGFRKPDPLIFRQFILQSHREPSDAILVDDSQKNLDSAAAFGFETVLFRPLSDSAIETHKLAMTFDEVTLLL
jgi:HAD superfamily hydrolase (TIGR01509 family)